MTLPLALLSMALSFTPCRETFIAHGAASSLRAMRRSLPMAPLLALLAMFIITGHREALIARQRL